MRCLKRLIHNFTRISTHIRAIPRYRVSTDALIVTCIYISNVYIYYNIIIESELSSDAVIVLGNPMATGNNPFGTKKDVDLGLSSTVLMY